MAARAEPECNRRAMGGGGLAVGFATPEGASRPNRYRRFGDDPPSPWPPNRARIGSGSSLRNLGDAARDRGSGGLGDPLREAPPRNCQPLPSRDRSVETLQTRYETFGRPRG